MPQRAEDFYARLRARLFNWLPAHTSHMTTSFRVRQDEHFLEQCVAHPHSGSPEWETDMYLFGFVNSLWSSLDSFAHELIAYYEGRPNPAAHPTMS